MVRPYAPMLARPCSRSRVGGGTATGEGARARLMAPSCPTAARGRQAISRMRFRFARPLLSVAGPEGGRMTILAMTKLVVGDVEKAKAFYEAVVGVREARRIQGKVGDRAITELI